MEKRIIRIMIRFTESEILFLKKKAAEKKETTFADGSVNFSGYLRKKILEESGWKRVSTDRELRELNYQIRKIGININQVAAKINSGYRGSDAVRQLQKDISEIQQKVECFTRKLNDGNHQTDEY